jgi:HlyD family secretion protein
MDLHRTDQNLRRRKRWILGVAIVVALSGITFAISRMKPAAPAVERNLVWIDTVKRGEMLREVRCLGTLVPEQISWIAARSAGRVDRIDLHPGAIVKPDDVILVLSNPDVSQAAADAESQLKSAEADFRSFKVQLESGLLAAESTAAAAKADYEQAKLRAQVNDGLFKKGLVSELDMRLSKVTAEQAEMRNTIEQKRYVFAKQGIGPQLTVKAAEVDRTRALTKLKGDELVALQVRAGMSGVLQVVPVEIGAQVAAGANLARVADPSRLKAEVHIAESQAKDVQLGQLASIDTHNGVVAGRVARIDPAVHEGTVRVDVTLTGALPTGARPDLSVEGTIQLERLANVVYVARPAIGQDNRTVGIFKLDQNGRYATRTPVRLGRSSVNTIEIVAGLAPGDRVILSDTSQWDDHGRIRLN